MAKRKIAVRSAITEGTWYDSLPRSTRLPTVAGAVIMADSRRIDDAFPSVDFCETRGIPFVVAVNRFDGELAHDLEDVRTELVLPSEVPLLAIDARSRADAKHTLIALVSHALRTGA